MLAATARGVRGVCEVRDAGLPVPLTDEGPRVHATDLDDALGRNRLARALLTTESLEEAEQHSRETCGYSEIDYERNKAAWLSEQQPSTTLDPDAVFGQVDQFEAKAHEHGATHTTFRRITEAIGLPGSRREALRKMLIERRPDQYVAPLWRISATSADPAETAP